ncbi:MAG TPA: ABC transporter permease subunit, partial [Myxococcaceae bacterium]|nr:ABC transporter permease subunit [Myxococcaceae bacterium]
MSARFLWLDVRATLGERKTLLAAGLMAYAVLAVPFLVAKPPEHVMAAMGTLFGVSEPFTLFLYLWTDLAMNKLVVILGLVLAGGLVARERETGVLAVLLSTPVSPARYYLVRALSACAVMGLLYVAGHLVAAPLVARSVPGFRAGTFFASMAVHLFAAFFCVCFSALMSVLVPKRSLAALVSLLVLFSL